MLLYCFFRGFHYIFIYSDYKEEWKKIKTNKEIQKKKSKEEADKKVIAETGIGDVVPLVTTLSSGREISDIYLRHPANESSEDEEGEEVPKCDTVQGKIV